MMHWFSNLLHNCIILLMLQMKNIQTQRSQNNDNVRKMSMKENSTTPLI
jgi:hypothetical protein